MDMEGNLYIADTGNSVIRKGVLVVLPQLGFANPPRTADGAVALALTGAGNGLGFHIDVSTNLTAWTLWQSFSNFTGQALLLDAAPGTGPARFYRLELAP